MEKQHYRLATIVVNYKTNERTVKYVKEELSKCSLEQIIVVVNNSATEQSTNFLLDGMNAIRVDDISKSVSSKRSVYVIHNPQNSGYAIGNNIGVHFLAQHFYVDNLLISNNDIVFKDNDVIESLLCKLNELPQVAVIGPNILGLDGHSQSPYRYFGFWHEMFWIPLERFVPFVKMQHFDHDQAVEGFYHHVMGCFFIIRFSDYIKCGMMDEKTFLFYEEAILADRLAKNGKREYYIPTVKVLHDHGLSMKKISNKGKNKNYMLESGLYYYKNYHNVSRVSIFICKVIRELVDFCIYFYRKNKRVM